MRCFTAYYGTTLFLWVIASTQIVVVNCGKFNVDLTVLLIVVYQCHALHGSVSLCFEASRSIES